MSHSVAQKQIDVHKGVKIVETVQNYCWILAIS